MITPLLVGRKGAVYVAPTVGAGTGTTGKKEDSGLGMQEFGPPHCWLDAQQIVPHDVCPWTVQMIGTPATTVGAGAATVGAAWYHDVLNDVRVIVPTSVNV